MARSEKKQSAFIAMQEKERDNFGAVQDIEQRVFLTTWNQDDGDGGENDEGGSAEGSVILLG